MSVTQEFNEETVIDQTRNVCRTTIVRDAWLRGQILSVHGWIYGLTDGLVRDLKCTATSPETAKASYQSALDAL
jgi:carbonic anhydrase